MSIAVMTKVWNTRGKFLKGSARLLLLAIADHANDDGYAYPGIDKLGKKTGISDRQVMRLIQKLEDEGWITVKRSANRVNKYQINLEKLKQASGDNMSPSLSGDNLTHGDNLSRDTSVTREVTSMSPEPSINHQNINVSSHDNMSPEYAKVIDVYFESNSDIDAITSQMINEAILDHGANTVIDALKEAQKRGKLGFRYANGILKNWRYEGRGNSANGSAPSKQDKAQTLINIVSKFGRHRGREALPVLKDEGLYDSVVRMGGWAHVCGLPEKEIKFAYYGVNQ